MLTRLMEAASNAKISLFIVNLGGRIFEGHISPITDAKQALAKACLSYANHDRKAYVLEPTTYMENIVAPWAIKRLLQHNTFEYPKGHLLWISHKTLGECVNALVDKVNELPSGHIKIQGPDSLLGPAVAAQLSTGMKKTISYEHLPFSAFGLMLDHIFGAPVGSIVSDYYYKWLEQNQNVYLDSPHDMDVLGVKGETISQWANRQNWAEIYARV